MSKNSSEYVGLEKDIGGDFLAIHRGDDGSIALVVDYPWPKDPDGGIARARSILMHEIGHEFWLEHVSDIDAVMGTGTNPDGTKFTRFEPHTDYNESDFLECLRVGICYKSPSFLELDSGGE